MAPQTSSTDPTVALAGASNTALRRRFGTRLGLVALAAAMSAGCTSGAGDVVERATSETEVLAPVGATAFPTAFPTVGESVGGSAESDFETPGLRERPGPRRQTTGDVPHIQLDAQPVASVNAELRRLVFSLPGVEERESVRSLPGATGIWIGESTDLARGEVLGGGREIAHIHPDGSLHVFLPLELAVQVEDAKWGELHPWVTREGFWGGVTMVYTPETNDEARVAFDLVVASYNFVVGAEVVAADFD